VPPPASASRRIQAKAAVVAGWLAVSQTFYGTDYSWLAADADDSVGWFSLNMSGPVPDLLCDDPDRMLQHEERLGTWVRSMGWPFQFGAGDSMWRDAAAIGVYPFDFDDKAQQYRLVAPPASPVRVSQVSPDVREMLVVRLATARFSTGIVTTEDVSAARWL
jgi:hypothetical protein